VAAKFSQSLPPDKLCELLWRTFGIDMNRISIPDGMMIILIDPEDLQ
jgi:hypothetical protein